MKMKFSEMADQVSEFLRQRERVSYRAVKREFDLDDELLEDLKVELIDARRIAVDEDGKVLVWAGAAPALSPESRVLSSLQHQTPNTQPLVPDPRPPVSYTPSHLAERIRAVHITDGERKTITALFADLKGSTALIEGLDPEEARVIIDPALQLMMDAVHQYEGYVAQALGDGIFALFGAPLAHEDHPQRALYAALRMQDEMRRHADTLRAKGYPPLLMRVGLNTGEVVLRSIRKDDLRADYVPVGHSTNLAARMEQLASPGAIVVSAYTHRLTDGYFAFKDLGPTQIKGVADSLNIYEVLGVGQLRTRLQVRATRRGLTRFVGRQSEMEQLQRALEQAKAGHGQIVGAMGEPGLGKSRLFYEFKLLSLSGCLVLEAYSVSHGKASPYLPVIELLKSYFDIQTADDERKRREKVNGKVLTLDRSLEDTLPYLFALLGVEEQPSPLAQMDVQIRRRRTFDALKKLFLRESLNQPIVLIVEDLHWIDGETQGFLDVLSESVASAKILLLTNYRPEYRHEWGQKTYYTQLRLAPLGQAEAEEFLDALLGESPRPVGERDRAKGSENNLQPLKQLILEKTQGTPFFMEEIVQELREQGVLSSVGAHPSPSSRAAPLPTNLHIPPTVQGILAARIDRLTSEEKALLQQLAVIGRQFPMSLIRQVITQLEADLYRLLSSLQSKEFIYEQPAFPESEYLFKHALTQDVAYNSVLIERRKGLHKQTGQAIEQLYKDKLEEHYSELAHHYQRSGNTEKAIEYLHKAGQQAAERSAYADAIAHFTTALDLLNTLPQTLERNQRELRLQLALGTPLVLTKGYTAPEVEATYLRARDLCRDNEDSEQLFPVFAGLLRLYYSKGDFQKACELGEQFLQLAHQVPDSPFLIFAQAMYGSALFALGESARARTLFERALALYDPQKHRPFVSSYGVDPGMVGLSSFADLLWWLGYAGQAQEKSDMSLNLAQEEPRPFNVTVSLDFAARRHQFRREPQAARAKAEAAIALATEHGFVLRLAMATAVRGWTLIEEGEYGNGIAQIQQALATFRETGALLNLTYYLSLLVEAYRKAGRIEEGLEALTEAQKIVEQTGERWYEAELYRLKGELLLQQENQKSKGKEQKSKMTNP